MGVSTDRGHIMGQPPYDRDWREYWQSLGQDWRTEPLIDEDRQGYLTMHRAIEATVEQYLFPFKDERLNRADIEWLLATHEPGGPVFWSETSQHERVGLDLSGAILSKVDLRGLPLARMRGGIGRIYSATDEQRSAAAVYLNGANLMEAHLEGADLRYAHLERANLSGAHLEGADLSYAHMERAQLVGAFLEDAVLTNVNLYRANLAGARLERANLSKAFLRQADFQKAQLQDAELRDANLEQSILIEAHLDRADLSKANGAGVLLSQAQLNHAILSEAYFEGGIFSQAHLVRANLWRAHLVGAVLHGAQLDDSYMEEACLDGAILREAHLHRTKLARAFLRGADLREAHLERADLTAAHLEGVTLWTRDAHGQPQPPAYLNPHGYEYWRCDDYGKAVPAEDLKRIWLYLEHFPNRLSAADLRQAFFDSGTKLDGAILTSPEHGSVRVADTRWNGANLSVVDWYAVSKAGLGDQLTARQKNMPSGTHKTPTERLSEYEEAIRANRQLSIALLAEGLDEIAIRFSIHAQGLEERVLWWQHRFDDLSASVFLNRLADLLAGYGYKPLRSILSYLFVIVIFTLLFAILGPAEGYHHTVWGWLVLSITSFHGRGLFPAPLDLEENITRLQALEAVIGLFVEVSLIAIYTRRFFFNR